MIFPTGGMEHSAAARHLRRWGAGSAPRRCSYGPPNRWTRFSPDRDHGKEPIREGGWIPRRIPPGVSSSGWRWWASPFGVRLREYALSLNADDSHRRRAKVLPADAALHGHERAILFTRGFPSADLLTDMAHGAGSERKSGIACLPCSPRRTPMRSSRRGRSSSRSPGRGAPRDRADRREYDYATNDRGYSVHSGWTSHPPSEPRFPPAVRDAWYSPPADTHGKHGGGRASSRSFLGLFPHVLHRSETGEW